MPEARLPDIAVPPILKGQNALVTGANSGIGQAVAIALGQAATGASILVDGGMTLYPGFATGG
jgi:glucose 1-dehydrogenase